MQDSRFLQACRLRPTDRTPVWLMRQAGRYLPEYRALRERYSLLDLCRQPELAAEVTLQPLRRFPLDAAIIFSDILWPLGALGIRVSFAPGDGPVIAEPLRTPREIERLPAEPDEAVFEATGGAIRLVRRELPSSVAVIGFAGAPFTLASYLIEGGSSRTYLATKRFLLEQRSAWERLLDRLAELTERYLAIQVAAGADAVQLFDSWAGALPPDLYREAVLPWTRRIVHAVQALGVPVIVFSTGTAGFLDVVAETDADVIGVDWRIDLDRAWQLIGTRAIQGNLDPAWLLAPREDLRVAVRRVLERAGRRPGHIFNLGHGVLPDTPPDAVATLVAEVHAWSTLRTVE
ncbi:uroporphyrinogen decarboxylase [Thermomicrobium sp. 4228-Ro]|uniref:uroporphyrinogen decarboxylase n=1 Tax=Thermomicrobium sp. 4228-Ro TaxID=2993937 RepID=UPI0022494806|nr:uroporphyrinogen decarboxylase [Thermomicrobium sp. 4228-Ro]MCX2726606.1 uroporphyrinogen decarboxylase [Thermomicrobium sp. 4228-Ro]